MLKNTFCHVPGVGTATEEKIWATGIPDWDHFKKPYPDGLPQNRIKTIENYIHQSTEHFDAGNPGYFARLLPSNQLWRLFPEFKDSVAYIDIETTGLDFYHKITTIALYDGTSVYWYVNGENLDDFRDDILNYSMIISYNGKCFDVPFIEKYFRIKLEHAHIDLRYVLASLGYKGGLKGCEAALGIDRGNITGIDGYFAVLLWKDYMENRNIKALETLLAYNMEDVVNLERLMVIAYNMNIKNTPFSETHFLETPISPKIPFNADRDTVDRIRRRI